MREQGKYCLKCKKAIKNSDLHKIIIYVIDEKFSEHHYEHIECSDRFTI